ncbi:magnesium protoporphyrin IX methyltransferase [Pseudahrensia aquimaris]|uniref:Magnesium protoporphyrin IX methyltransferase n=1 Tax=Pseudahrensia aquimaris TaxID=744461 RepID=A0ABW3FIP1_9HYPH
MADTNYDTRRGELKTYFDRTAADKWVALTSNTPVSRIRETVRAGREATRSTFLEWLPHDLTGMRILDAGCGTGMLAAEISARGAHVVAIDISPALIEEAKRRLPTDLRAHIDFRAGDMSDSDLGTFDYIVAMDSFIHYPLSAIIELLEGYAPRVKRGLIFTFAPRTPALAAMKTIGKLFPKNDRSPAIEPVAEDRLAAAIEASHVKNYGLRAARTRRISTAFYKTQLMELVNA